MINALNTVSNWQRAARAHGPTEYTEKMDRLERDLVTLSALDDTARDKDPVAGNVNAPQAGFLKQTADGFTLHVLRGTPGGPVFPQSVTDYTVNLKSNTVQVTDLNPVVIGPSYCSSPGGQSSCTLDVNAQALTAAKRGPVPAGTPHVSWGGPYREI